MESVGGRFQQDPFLSQLEEGKARAPEKLHPEPGARFKEVASAIHFMRSAVVSQVMATADLSSEEDLFLVDCPSLANVYAKNVYLIRCPDRGLVKAVENIYYLDCDLGESEAGGDEIQYFTRPPDPDRRNEFKNGTTEYIDTCLPTIYLINFEVKEAIYFRNGDGVDFRGKVFMDSESRIGDLINTNADIIRLNDRGEKDPSSREGKSKKRKVEDVEGS